MTNIYYISLSSKLDANKQFQTGSAMEPLQYTVFNVLGPWGCPVIYTLKQ